MLILLSPSKTIKISQSGFITETTLPDFLKQSGKIVKTLKRFSFDDLQKLLNTSRPLTQTAMDYYQLWNREHTSQRSCPAILAFQGEAYSGFRAEEMSNDTLLYAQQKLLIFSGLYGVLRPLDLIQPYRLDVADSILIDDKNLYHFWKNPITLWIKKQFKMQGDNTIINLASKEYFKMLDQKKLNCEIVTPVFKDRIGDEYKIVSVFAKQSRGKMARFILENKITDADSLKFYEKDSYFFNEKMSTNNQFVFTRG
ncbi:MAG: hypothetical protein A2W85_12195 [Bacteroidetes bacterium GWF2_41_31]|nr:MAG: hypothetical protein A2W85_12195 [Bacteroidetes bacterium GWF2_41_31]